MMQGRFQFNNITLKEDLMMSLLGTNIINRWWENYWILRAELIKTDKRQYFSTEEYFYILSYMRKQRILQK